MTHWARHKDDNRPPTFEICLRKKEMEGASERERDRKSMCETKKDASHSIKLPSLLGIPSGLQPTKLLWL